VSEACDVLVIDDEPVVGDAIRLVLRDAGLRVTSVLDAETALAHPALDACRVLICDLMLPGLSGLDALAAVHARRPRLPVVLTTGYVTPDEERKALAAGALAFLPKPFDDSELLTLVRRALERADAAAEEPSP
jgi:two-component system, LuxR family, response regulator FixJ